MTMRDADGTNFVESVIILVVAQEIEGMTVGEEEKIGLRGRLDLLYFYCCHVYCILSCTYEF